MFYEWEDTKELENRRKHKISLSAGISVFDDPYRLESYDDRFDYNEDRFITIGKDSTLDILYVCYTMRYEGHTTRLISVRRAEKHERRLYEKHKQW
ncbi:hypothetical protein MSP8887_01011 [Marinomonas spartinae]|uniref:BrnT family toxin n=1 Tax=Marinomonas spartinae TaxID=1792290 RepID=UPI000808E1B9|nr:hypothetical protein MSP8887_01011 [Marinomonas spartinae]